MTEPLPSRFPEPLADDDDDVAWALQTAKVQWLRGTKADAVVWLRRAADSADAIDVWRAADIRRSADELTTKLSSVRPAFSRPPPVPSMPSAPPSPRPRAIADRLGVASPSPLPPYVPVSDMAAETESRHGSFDEIVLHERRSRVELLSADLIEDDDDAEQEAEEIHDFHHAHPGTEDAEDEAEEIEADLIDDDTIGDDALDARDPPLPAFPIEPSTDLRLRLYGEEAEDDPVTQPQLDDPLPFLAPKRVSGTLPGPEPVFDLEPEAEADPMLGDLVLGEVHGLEDIPPEAQAALVDEALIESLKADEEVPSFGLALVLKGAVKIMPAIADLSCARAGKGDIVWGQGNLVEGVALRLVAAESGTEVAVWDAALIKSAVRDCPWVIDDLKALADRFQALAGVAMGPMGERLDDSLRGMVTGRCEIKRLLPNEELAARGKPIGGMYIVAAGRIEVVDGEAVESELGPGQFLFGPQVLSNGPAPRTARAGKGGALLLFAGRSVAHELLMTVPPLLEIFAS